MDILGWLLKWPTPWDLFASLAAMGSLFVSWRQWRASQQKLKPIFAASAFRRDDGMLRVRVTVTNREDHPLSITKIKMPRCARCATTRYEYVMEEGVDREVLGQFQRTMPLNELFKATGKNPTMYGRTQHGHGDTGSFEFVALAPSRSQSLAIRLTVEPQNSDLRSFTKKIAVKVQANQTAT